MVSEPLLINSYDNKGGAARATFRLHQGLKRRGIDSKMLVQTKISDDDEVIGPTSRRKDLLSTIRFYLDYLPIAPWYAASHGTMKNFSPAWLPDRVGKKVATIDPELVHLNWIVGFMNPKTIRTIDCPIVWTFHDMWPFTGGCHYSGDCTNYEDECGSCPIFSGDRERDLSRWVWNRKRDAWADFSPTIVTPSTWLADCARSSSLFNDARIEVIPYGIDTEIFRPVETGVARNELGLPEDANLLLFGSGYTTPRKGLHHLVKAVDILKERGWTDNLHIAIFGSIDSNDVPDLPFETHVLGFLNDTELRHAYSAADVSVVPSVEDNLPNIVMETLACGTPCVGFRVGGIPDMISHKENGYLAAPGNASDLASGIEWVLENADRSLGIQARNTVEERFERSRIIDKHVSLYDSIIR